MRLLKTTGNKKWIEKIVNLYLSENYFEEIKHHIFWVGWCKGEKTSLSSMVVLEDGLCYLSSTVVLPEFRGKRLQRRHIKARLAEAKKQGCKQVVTYTHLKNYASANNLIKEGFLLYEPECKWAGYNQIYWLKTL